MTKVTCHSFLVAALLVTVSAYSGLFQPFSVGAFNGTVVSDGTLVFCHNPYKADDDAVRDVLRFHRGSDNMVHSVSINVVVVDIRGERVMVDTGANVPPESRADAEEGDDGHGTDPDFPFREPEPDGGKLLASMRMAGIPPESIDTVVLTHVHPDHAAGLVTTAGDPAFPNARIFVSAREHEFWSDPTNDTERTDFDVLREISRSYLNAIAKYHGKVGFLDDRDVVSDGVRIRLTPGHTPGHAVVEFEQDGSRLAVIGDLWHLRELQVKYPSTGISFDTDSTSAHRSREKMMALFEQRGDVIVAYHDHFPGLGYIRKMKGKTHYDWVPASINDLQPDRIAKCP